MTDMLLRGGCPWRWDGAPDILVRDGLIHQVAPAIDAPGAQVIDITGQLVLPGLADAHCHLDKTLHRGPRIPPSADDTLAGRSRTDLARRRELRVPSVA